MTAFHKIRTTRGTRFAIVTVIAVAWAPIAWSGSLTWDDWVSQGASEPQLRVWAHQMGRLSTFLTFPLSNPAFNYLGVPAVRIVGIFAMIGTGLFAWTLARKLNFLGRREAQFVGMFVGMLPVDTTRSMVTTSMYVWCLFLFFFATSLSQSRSRLLFLLSLPTFFVSFETSSLLVMLTVPSLMIISQTLWSTRERFFRVAGLFGTAVTFWTIKQIWFAPYGSYEGYNRVGMHGLLTLIVGLAAIAVLARVFWYAVQAVPRLMEGPSGLAAVGVLLSAVGLLPYATVGNYPPFLGTGTRHYTASGLGIAFVAVALARLIGRNHRKLKSVALASLAVGSILFVWLNCLLSMNYWSFQQQAEEFFEVNPVPRNTLVVIDSEESSVMKLSRFLGPNFALTWYVPTGLIDSTGERASLAVMQGDLDRVRTGRIKCCPPSFPWSQSKGFSATTRIDVDVTFSGGLFGFFPIDDFDSIVTEMKW